MTITGSVGIPSAEAFGVGAVARQPQEIVGGEGIPSAEAFGAFTGVRIAIQTVPVALYYSH
jgi:hypothetical protein